MLIFKVIGWSVVTLVGLVLVLLSIAFVGCVCSSGGFH
jgi:hypothetical protein